MTNREFLTVISTNESVPAEVAEYATAALAKLDAANEKRKNTPSKKAVENAPLVEKIVNEVLSTEAKTASDVAAALFNVA